MTFLQSLSGFGKKITIALVIIGCFGLTVFAQKVQPGQKNCCYGDPGFVGEKINLNVVNADVRDILNYITEQYGINFVIDKSVKQVPVTVNISEVPWNIALDAILSSQEIGVEVKGPILRIADAKTLAQESDIKAKIKESVLDNSPLYTEFIKLSYAMASGSGGGSAFSTGTNVGGATGGGAGGDGLLPIIKRRLSRRGAIETDSRTNSLIITDVRENIDAIRQLVAVLDQPEPQVEVEARVVIASRDFSRDVGIQLSGAVFGNGVGQNGGVNANTGLSPTGGTTATTGGTGGTGGTGNTTETVLNKQGNTNLVSQIANTVVGLTTGRIGTAQINLLLTAGESKGQAKTIATPRVTMLNNRKGVVESGQQIPVVTTQTGANGGGVVFTTTYVSVPLKLEVTPQITENDTVLLDVVVENSSVSSTVSTGGAPAINTQRTKVNVEVPDGGTTVVGGAMVDVEGENVFRTPGISKIPIIGNLFKRKAVARSTSEIIFFITPRINRPDYASPNGSVKRENRTTTILQPVPLGNPPSNSLPETTTQQPTVTPVVPATQPTPQGSPIKPQ